MPPSSSSTSCSIGSDSSSADVEVSDVARAEASTSRTSARVSTLSLLVSGMRSSCTTTAGCMYTGSLSRSAARSTAVSTVAGVTQSTSCCREPAVCTSAAADSTCAHPSRAAASISPSSMRWPRSFTCWSMRPRHINVPSSRHRARSPDLYSLPSANGLATKRAFVSSGRRR